MLSSTAAGFGNGAWRDGEDAWKSSTCCHFFAATMVGIRKKISTKVKKKGTFHFSRKCYCKLDFNELVDKTCLYHG